MNSLSVAQVAESRHQRLTRPLLGGILLTKRLERTRFGAARQTL